MDDDPKPMFKGLMCRCLVCCCKPGEGHRDPAWIAWEARHSAGMTELQAAVETGIELRQRCDPMGGTHSTPHVGCIMR